MKKTLIAAAALTAAAGAMADVSITGVFDTTLRMSEFDNGLGAANSKKKTTQVGRDGSGTSGLYFSAKEDLGDGLVALGFMELDASPFDAPTTFNGGEKYAGLQGSFGTIKLGSPNTPSLSVQSGLRGAMFGTKDGGRGTAGGATAAGNANFIATSTLMGVSLTRFSSSIRYDSPSFSGFSFAVNYVPESDDGKLSAGQANNATSYAAGDTVPVQGAISDIGLFYKAGPINAGLTSYTEDADLGTVAAATLNSDGTTSTASAASLLAWRLTSAKTTQTSFGLQYNLGFAILGVGANKTEWTGGMNAATDIEASGTNVLATVPLSEALALGLNYQMATFKDNGGTLFGVANTEVKYTQLALGVNYNLSKLTSVYARYVSASNDAALSSQKDASATTTLFGLMTKF